MTVTAEMVKLLRERTGLGMMACRDALVEATGDAEKAVELLRKKGELKAAKRAERGTSEGSIAVSISEDQKTIAMIEIGCETDFVARNPDFRKIVEGLAGDVAAWNLDGTVEDAAEFDPEGRIASVLTDTIAKLGENILFRQAARFAAQNGITGFYLHSNFKIGVIIEIDCPEAAAVSEEVRALAKDICMQVASLNPICVSRDDVPADMLDKEREIYREQVKDKPTAIRDKIIEGKINAFCKDNVLLQQQFVKEQKTTVAKHIEQVGKSAGAALKVRRFIRFEAGR